MTARKTAPAAQCTGHLWWHPFYRFMEEESETELSPAICIRCGSDIVSVTTSGVGGVIL